MKIYTKLGVVLLGAVQLFTAQSTLAHQETDHADLKAKVLHAYAQLAGKNYTFDLSIRSQRLPPKPKHSLEQETWYRRETINKQLAEKQGLSATEQQWMQEGLMLDDIENDEARINLFQARLMDAYLNRYQVDMHGVMDFKKGLFSLQPKLSYQTENLQASLIMPMVLDVNSSKLYLGLSGFSPFFTDPSYDGRYVLIDYAEFIKDKKIKPKALQALLQEYLRFSPSMSHEENFKQASLTDEDRQKGGVEKIHFKKISFMHDFYTLLFFYLNQGYLTHDATNIDVETLLKQFVGSAYQLDAKEVARIEEKQSRASNLERFPELDLAKQLQAFDQYKTDRLLGAEQIKKIIEHQPEASKRMMQTIFAKHSQFNIWIQRAFGKDNNYGLDGIDSTDVLLDKNGRMLALRFSVEIKDLLDSGGSTFLNTLDINFYDYNSSQVDTTGIAQAVPLAQLSNKFNSIFPLIGLLGKDYSAYYDQKFQQRSENWQPSTRYAQLAQSMLSRNKTKLEAFQSLLMYAVLLEDIDKPLRQEQKAKLDKEVERVSLMVASQRHWPLTAQQQTQLQDTAEQSFEFEFSSDMINELLSVLEQAAAKGKSAKP